jgi:uncharacterized protein YndB with AHSA1/START domain
MSAVATTSGFGELIDANTLRIERLLPGPVERLWDYLVKSELRQTWLAAGDMVVEAGTAVELVWRNDELTSPPGRRPANISEENRMKVSILEVEVLRKLTISWGSEDSTVTFELQPKERDVLLTVTHRNIPSRDSLLNVAPGWHAHLDVLSSVLRSADAAPFWDEYARLKHSYDKLIPERPY